MLLTIRQFAARLSVTERRARALVASRRVTGATKIGRDWLIPASTQVAPGKRGPASRAASGSPRIVLAAPGKAQALKSERQRRFRQRASGSAEMASSATVFRLSRNDIIFKELELESDDLN